MEKKPKSGVIVTVRKCINMPNPPKGQKNLDTIITPDSAWKRTRVSNERKLTDHELWLRTNFPEEEKP